MVKCSLSDIRNSNIIEVKVEYGEKYLYTRGGSIGEEGFDYGEYSDVYVDEYDANLWSEEHWGRGEEWDYEDYGLTDEDVLDTINNVYPYYIRCDNKEYGVDYDYDED